MTEFKTDFIPIPFIAIQDERLTPASRTILGLIYYISEKRGDKFFMSNKYIGDVLRYSSSAVANGLTLLEKFEYITRTFKDEKKRNRLEIMCNIKLMLVTSKKETDSSNKEWHDSSNKEHNKINIINKISNKKEGKKAIKEIPEIPEVFEQIYRWYYKLFYYKNDRGNQDRFIGRIKKLKTEWGIVHEPFIRMIEDGSIEDFKQAAKNYDATIKGKIKKWDEDDNATDSFHPVNYIPKFEYFVYRKENKLGDWESYID